MDTMDIMDMKTKNTSVETDDPLLASQELLRNVKSEVGNEQQTDLVTSHWTLCCIPNHFLTLTRKKFF